MSRIVPPDLENESRRLVRTVGLVLGVLVAGAAVIALAAGAFKVSDLVGFGIWGGVGVCVAAAIAGIVVWITSTRADRRRSAIATPRGRKPTGRVVALPGRLADALEGRTPRSPAVGTSTKPGLGSPSGPAGIGSSGAGLPGIQAAGAGAGDGRSNDRAVYYQALGSGDLDQAMTVLARLRAGGENPIWCDNAQRRIEHLRRRG
jgi:hypothetical protein